MVFGVQVSEDKRMAFVTGAERVSLLNPEEDLTTEALLLPAMLREIDPVGYLLWRMDLTGC